MDISPQKAFWNIIGEANPNDGSWDYALRGPLDVNSDATQLMGSDVELLGRFFVHTYLSKPN